MSLDSLPKQVLGIGRLVSAAALAFECKLSMTGAGSSLPIPSLANVAKKMDGHTCVHTTEYSIEDQYSLRKLTS